MGFNFGALSMGFGDVLFNSDKVYGKKPKLPPVKPLDLGEEQALATANNLENLPGMEDLVGKANLFSREQILKMLNSQMPFDEIQKAIGENMQAGLEGTLSEDVLGKIGRENAAWGIESGVGGGGGSSMAANRFARNIGKTTYDIQQETTNSFQNWMRNTASLFQPGMMNVTSMFISPEQQTAFDRGERDIQFQHDWLQNQIRAMPDPQAAGNVNTGMSLLATIRGSPSPAPVAGSQGVWGQNPYSGPAGGSAPRTYGPGGYSTAPNEGYGGYDAQSYYDSMDTSFAADYAGEMGY